MVFRISILLLLFSAKSIFSTAQVKEAKQIKPTEKYDNIHVQKIYNDSLVSTFVIWVKKEVKTHKHMHHSENIYVLEGKGRFTLGDSTYLIKKGDMLFVPKNTWHAVTTISKKPLKVISIQAPHFDGSDRILK
jgi:mannose-6-phosphate isomerase-like protein (cupin superfamily)